jgi:hypothetical protein
LNLTSIRAPTDPPSLKPSISSFPSVQASFRTTLFLASTKCPALQLITYDYAILFIIPKLVHKSYRRHRSGAFCHSVDEAYDYTICLVIPEFVHKSYRHRYGALCHSVIGAFG